MDFAMNLDTPLFCRVKGCNFARTHATVDHKCGNCNKFGHGKVECNSQYKQNNLLLYHDDAMPPSLWCTAEGCKKKEYHMIDSHYCSMCNVRGHMESDCPQLESIYTMEEMHEDGYNIDKISSYIMPGQYMNVWSGMGTYTICRKLANNTIEGLFISTSTVYYDERVHFMKKFSEGYTEVFVDNQKGLIPFDLL
jgi:hypothetical protein